MGADIHPIMGGTASPNRCRFTLCATVRRRPEQPCSGAGLDPCLAGNRRANCADATVVRRRKSIRSCISSPVWRARVMVPSVDREHHVPTASAIVQGQPADTYNRNARARRIRSRTRPANAAVHATSAMQKKTCGTKPRKLNPNASPIRSVPTAYIPSGKTAPQ